MHIVSLAVATVWLLLVLNGLHPARSVVFGIPSFFAAWLTVELAPQALGVLLGTGVVLGLLDGFAGTAGSVALALLAVAAVGLASFIRLAVRSAGLADAVLAGWPEPGGEAADPDLPEPGEGLRDRVRRFLLPFAVRHPEVERIAAIPYVPDAVRRQHLDVYRNVRHPTGSPVLLQIHGGAWVIGEREQQGRPLMNALAARGWVCVAPGYRLSPQATWPDHIVDVKRALAWVREHVAEYGGDPSCVVVTGGSAGGHLAALLALSPNDPAFQPGFEDVDTTVQGCVSWYGVYDLLNETGTGASRYRLNRLLAPLVFKRSLDQDRDAFARASPLARVSAAAPPFLVVHGRNDTLVPVVEARLFTERLRAASREPVLYLELPGTTHAFDVFGSMRTRRVIRMASRFVALARVRAQGHPGQRDGRPPGNGASA